MELAGRIGKSRPSLIDYESGKRAPGADTLLEIAAVLEQDLVFGGFVIERPNSTRLKSVPYQLRLKFDAGGGAEVRIQPSEDELIITPVQFDLDTGT
jgi:transcriptional regulator with XRE-family HTH domain